MLNEIYTTNDFFLRICFWMNDFFLLASIKQSIKQPKKREIKWLNAFIRFRAHFDIRKTVAIYNA